MSFETWFDTNLSEWDAPQQPGGIFVVMRGEQPIAVRSWGRANLEFDQPWTLDTRYRIASLTKMFTAYAALLLHESGHLQLEHPLGRYLPEMPPELARITLEQLLNMTSGIRHEEETLLRVVGESHATLDSMFELVRRSPLHFQPGTYGLYSCANYRLMARIIERITEESLGDHFERVFFAPLHMTQTRYDSHFASFEPQLASLYQATPTGWQRVQFDIEMSGDGALISSARDLMRWTEYLRDQKRTHPERLKRLVTASSHAFYGLGLAVMHHRDQTLWAHSGSFGAYWLHLHEADISVMALSNRQGVPLWVWARELADIALGLTNTVDQGAVWFGYDQHAQSPSPWSSERLQPCLGTYTSRDGPSLRLELWHGALCAVILGQSEMLQPIGATIFASTLLASGLRLELLEANRLRVLLPQGPCEYQRLDSVSTTFNPRQGRYRNAELNFEFGVSSTAQQLTLERWGGTFPRRITLQRLSETLYEAEGYSLRFESACAFRLSIHRARELRFDHIESAAHQTDLESSIGHHEPSSLANGTASPHLAASTENKNRLFDQNHQELIHP
jgi:CubicO group peptidase (beta-lactamase class C family)